MVEKIIEKVKCWAAPYSPIFGLTLEEIDLEMAMAREYLNDKMVMSLIDSIPTLTDIEAETLVDFISGYMKSSSNETSVQLIRKLSDVNARYIFDLLAFTHNPAVLMPITSKVNYHLLDEESKISFISMLGQLNSRDAIAVLTKLGESETDEEIQNDIRIVSNNLSVNLR